MKRLQVLVPDEVFDALRKEAKRKESTVADLVRRGIDRQLASAIDAPWRRPTFTPAAMGPFKISPENSREAEDEGRAA